MAKFFPIRFKRVQENSNPIVKSKSEALSSPKIESCGENCKTPKAPGPIKKPLNKKAAKTDTEIR